jgi:hypothetical protein
MPVKRAKSAEYAADEAYRIAMARRREPAAQVEHARHRSENPERQARATKALSVRLTSRPRIDRT